MSKCIHSLLLDNKYYQPWFCVLLFYGKTSVIMDVDTHYRDANHSDFCGIIPFFKADFRNTILGVKIPQNNDFTSKNGTR